MYVPTGYRLGEAAFREFISARFVWELKALWHDFARLEAIRSAHISRVAGYSAERAAASMEQWHRIIEERYSAPCTPPSDEDPSPFESGRSMAQDLMRQWLSNVEAAEAIERIFEGHDDVAGCTSSYGRCLKLLRSGCWGYWDENRGDLSTAFRADFVEGRRRAFALADDGSMPSISAEWWRSPQCTDALMSQNFRHPAGPIVEKLQTPAEANDPTGRKLAAVSWLHDQHVKVADLPDDKRRERFRSETEVIISKGGWMAAKEEFLLQRPDLRRAFTRSGPRKPPA